MVDKHYDHNELKSEIKNYDVLVVRSKTTVDKSIIDASLESSKLKLIIRAGVGLDNIDLEYANKNNIIVKNTQSFNSSSSRIDNFFYACFIKKYNISK